MKAISLWQPWATLVAIGAKRWETRKWYMSYRGELAIHAALTRDHLDVADSCPFSTALWIAGYGKGKKSLPFGAVLCVVNVKRCLWTKDAVDAGLISPDENAFGDYRPVDKGKKRYCTELELIKVFAEPIPASGRQLFWNWNQ